MSTTGGAPARAPGPVVQIPGKGTASDSFQTVVSRIQPVAESLCRQRNRSGNCDYRITVDRRAGLPPNAFQTLDENGRPLIIFTQSLLDDMSNANEVAFVMGHETAHHIAGHIPLKQQNTAAGAALAGLLAAAAGGNPDAIKMAQEVGAFAGSRQYSKNYELEADSLGTIVTYQAGYDPLRGAQYFERMADPGDTFLGTHPPNADRMRVVRQTMAELP